MLQIRKTEPERGSVTVLLSPVAGKPLSPTHASVPRSCLQGPSTGPTTALCAHLHPQNIPWGPSFLGPCPSAGPGPSARIQHFLTPTHCLTSQFSPLIESFRSRLERPITLTGLCRVPVSPALGVHPEHDQPGPAQPQWAPALAAGTQVNSQSPPAERGF